MMGILFMVAGLIYLRSNYSTNGDLDYPFVIEQNFLSETQDCVQVQAMNTISVTPQAIVTEQVFIQPDQQSATPDISGLPSPIRPSLRIGFGLSLKTDPEVWASRLGASWYLDWAVNDQTPQGGLEHWQLIRITANGYKPGTEKIARAATLNPGQVWILGNEPDVIWQDNVPPAVYARYYHEVSEIIKGADETALLAIAGVAQGTPLRLQYLDLVLDAYRNLYGGEMPVDWWTVHGYVLREERNSWGVGIPPSIAADRGMLYEIVDNGRIDYFETQIRGFRRWMADQGYREKPLALTEFGIPMPTDYGFPPEFVIQYLNDTFSLLNTMQDPNYGYPLDGNRLVQRWAWFSLADSNFPTSNLANLEHNQLTVVGLAFRDYIESLNSPEPFIR